MPCEKCRELTIRLFRGVDDLVSAVRLAQCDARTERTPFLAEGDLHAGPELEQARRKALWLPVGVHSPGLLETLIGGTAKRHG